MELLQIKVLINLLYKFTVDMNSIKPLNKVKNLFEMLIIIMSLFSQIFMNIDFS